MPNTRINVKAQYRGPIFNANATKAAANRMIIGVNDEIAKEGVRRVKQRLGQVLQNPTGYYESNIVVDRRTVRRGVSDNGVVYGGWLEGVDSRNKTSRFKGYRTFRLVKQEMDRDAEMIARPIVARMVGELQ